MSSQTVWEPIGYQTSLNGTNLTYYRGTTFEKCQADCGGNPNCKGFTFIRAGAYNRSDPPMCYLASEVTGSATHSCCISGVKKSNSNVASDCRSGNDYGITVNPNRVRPGEKMCVNFSYPGGKPASGDWIGYFPVGSNQYIEWYWVKDLINCEAIFTANKAANYEFRYLLEGGYDKVATRADFTVVDR